MSIQYTSAAEKRRVRILDLLQDGFGVEDIALKIDAPADAVRFVVRSMRAIGELNKIFSGPRGC